LKDTVGRGKKQRIQKKIDKMNGVVPTAKSGKDGDTGATVEHPKTKKGSA